MPPPRRSRQNPEVREFILRNVKNHPQDVGSLAAKTFGLSRTSINRYIKRLAEERLIESSGNTRATQYRLVPIVEEVFPVDLFDGLPEDHVWRFRVQHLLGGLKQNVVDICQYGFTEILNNAIDHSGSKDAIISIKRTYADVTLQIWDRGVGIFKKLQNDFELPDVRSALLELSKGKITSDSRRHSGEGIFFTSRMFDHFFIRSGESFYHRTRLDDDDWLIDANYVELVDGTFVEMELSTHANWTTQEVFDKYQDDDILFRKTHVPIALGRYPGEQLVSRSQAKRILARFDQFSEVMLDFKDVSQIGQAFADEIFRVYAANHPRTKIVAIRTSPEITRMIEFVRKNSPSAEGPPKV